MRIRGWVVALAAGLAFCMPASADDRPVDPLAQLDPEALFGGMVREADVALLFAYLRSALIAASQGKHVPPPEELNRRAQALGDELKLRGTLAGLLVLGAIEHSARQALREPLPFIAPPAAPLTPSH